MSDKTTLQRYVSDELTHFVGRGLSQGSRDQEGAEWQYNLLVGILRSGTLGVNKKKSVTATEANKFSENQYYKPNVVCFSDIPVPDLAIHMEKYSRFGLAFRKTFLIGQGANPVFYLARQAVVEVPQGHQTLASYFDEQHARLLALQDELKNGDDPQALSKVNGHSNRDLEEMFAFLVFHLFSYCKFFDVDLSAGDPENYYMEREWRVFGRLNFQLTDVRRVMFPELFAKRFRQDLPEYYGEITFS